MSKAEPELWRLVPSVSGLLASSHGSLMVTPYCAPMPFGGERQYGGEPTQGQWDGKRFIVRANRPASGGSGSARG